MSPAASRPPSLARRLVLLALGWSLATLILTAVGLGLLFQQSAVRRLDQTLRVVIETLVSGSTVDGDQVFAPLFTDELALRAYSGRYWEIAELTTDGKLRVWAQSYSLFGSLIGVPKDVVAELNAHPGKPISYPARGPQNEPLRVRAEEIRLPKHEAPVIFLAGEDRTSVNRDLRSFLTASALLFIALGAGLVIAIFVQVRVGLRAQSG